MDKEKIITLEEYENRRGCLDSYEAAAIIKLLCITLAKLHAGKMAYRELCPSNILLACKNEQRDGVFTEARLAESMAPRQYREGATEDTVLMGIERYAAPEQYGFAQSMPATDIFAVGVIFNEMLTGKVPEEERAAQPVCACMIEKCCSLDWKKRYKNVTVLLKDIEWYLSHRKCGKAAWGIHKNRKLIVTGAALIAGCAALLLWAGFAIQSIHKGDDINPQAQKAPIQALEKKQEQEKEQKEEYLKYTIGSREMVIYYPKGFHYFDKSETENSVIVFFAPDTGDTGMLGMALFDNDSDYSLEKGVNEILLQGFIDTYPGGETIYKEVGEGHFKMYYQFTSDEQQDWIIGTQANLEQNDETVVAAMGFYDAAEDKRYREYLEDMMEKIEY